MFMGWLCVKKSFASSLSRFARDAWLFPLAPHRLHLSCRNGVPDLATVVTTVMTCPFSQAVPADFMKGNPFQTCGLLFHIFLFNDPSWVARQAQVEVSPRTTCCSSCLLLSDRCNTRRKPDTSFRVFRHPRAWAKERRFEKGKTGCQRSGLWKLWLTILDAAFTAKAFGASRIKPENF